MFTRAGFNLQGARIWRIHARVAVLGGQRCGWARPLRFASGDMAWYSREAEFLIWGNRARFVDLVHLDFQWNAWRLPKSDLADGPRAG